MDEQRKQDRKQAIIIAAAIFAARDLATDWNGVLDKSPAVVLSQIYDVQSRNFLQIARIFPVGADTAYLGKLKNRKVLSAVWMPTHPPEFTGECYADLEQIQTIHKTCLRRIRPAQHFRLSAHRTRLLQQTLTRYFGRPNSYDSHSDSAPSSGFYLCARCFYMHGNVTSIELPEGASFLDCSTCASTPWVIPGR